MALAAGTVLEDRYRVEQLMGQGGMGAVYRAYDNRLQQVVAIKANTLAGAGISAQSLAASRQQFEREALMLAGLRHPNLPRVMDHWVTPEGDQYLVMDYIEGGDLAQVMAQSGALPETQALAWIGQVCDALEHLHSQQPPIVHRDVKPQNIRVDSKGQVFLVDFGIAKLGDTDSQTLVGAQSVTPGFSPPEQYSMGGTDARTDVYALGATLYALLTGQVPPDSIALQSGDKQLVPPRQMNADVSPEVQQAVMMAMQPRRTDRPQSVAEFRRLLQPDGGLRGNTVALSAPVAEAAARKPPSQVWPLALGGAGIVVALIVLGLMVLPGLSGRPSMPPSQAPSQTPPLPTLTAVASQPTGTVPPPTATARPVETSLPTAVRPTERPTAVSTLSRTSEQVDAIVLGKGITVTYWHERSEHNQATLQAMLDEFNRTNKYGITARAQIAGTSYADLYKQVESAIKAGAPPELSAAFQSQAAIYRATGAIVDLGPFVQSKQYGLSQSDLDDFPPAMPAGDVNPQFPGERLGWPVQRAMDVLYYNADWLRQLGYAAPPQDWKQFEEMACKAVDRGKGKTGWAVRHDATNFATLVLSRGGRILATDGQSYTFNSSSGVDAVQMIQRMMAQGCAVEVPTSERFGEEARFANGQVLFVLASSISLPYYADSVGKAAKFKWSIAPPPASGRPLVVLSGASLSIHKTTPEKELAAWLVIKFLSERAQTARWAEETGYLPIRASAQAGVLAGLRTNRFYSPVADLYAKLFEWLPFAASEPSVAGYDTVRYSMDRDVLSRAVADPRADAKALLDAAVKKANDALK